MQIHRFQKMMAVLALGAAATGAEAALLERGGGAAYYDDVLNITWLADANLAATQSFGVAGIAADGTMSWHTAQSWVGALSDANYLGVSSWRLPTLAPVNGTNFVASTSYDGSTDMGYNYSGTQSELAYNFYTNLGGTAMFAPNGFFNFPWGLPEDTTPFPYIGTARAYWTGLATSPDEIGAWVFGFGDGAQGTLSTDPAYAGSNNSYAWAVASGDVLAPVPVPAAFWLFGSGLLGLVRVSRRRKA